MRATTADACWLPRASLADRIATPGVHALSASPGFGATMLASQAAHLLGRPNRWVDARELDATTIHVRDDDTATITRYSMTDADWAERTWSDADSPDGGQVVVVDGLEWQADENAVERRIVRLRELVARRPAPATLIITTHIRPEYLSLGTSSVRFTDEHDLRWTVADVALLAKTCGADIDEPQAEAITELTGGWPAAIDEIVRRTAQGGHESAEAWYVGEGNVRLLAPFIASLSNIEIDFLKSCGTLPYVSASLCDAALGRDDSTAVLSMLSRRWCYLERIGPLEGTTEERWRMTRPLAMLVRRRTSGQAVNDIQVAAARWLTTIDQPVDAIKQLVTAQQSEQAIEAIGELDDGLLRMELVRELQEVLTTLPARDLNERATNAVTQGWVSALAGKTAAAAHYLSDYRTIKAKIEQSGLAETDPAELLALDRVEGDAWALDATLARMDADPARMTSSGKQALALLGDIGPRTMIVDAAELAVIYGQLWVEDSAGALQSIAHMESAASQPVTQGYLEAAHAHGLLLEGRVIEALAVTDRLIGRMEHQGIGPCDLTRCTPAITHEWGRLENGNTGPDVAAALRRCLDSSMDKQQYGDALLAARLLARCLIADGRIADTAGVITEAKRMLRRHNPRSPLGIMIMREEILMHLCAGDVFRANRIATRLPDDPRSNALRLQIELALGKTSASTQISKLPATTPLLAVQRELLAATVGLTSKRSLAIDHINNAAALAERHGMHLALLGHSPELVEVATWMDKSLRTNVLLALGGSGTSDAPRPSAPLPDKDRVAPTAPVAARPMRPTQIQLLELMASPRSFGEIADELGVSQNTVKTRVRAIYTKLGVNSREDAVSVAEQQGLISID